MQTKSRQTPNTTFKKLGRKNFTQNKRKNGERDRYNILSTNRPLRIKKAVRGGEGNERADVTFPGATRIARNKITSIAEKPPET